MARDVVIGLRQLDHAVEHWSHELREAVAEAVREGAEELRDMERRDAPVDTGRLRDGIDIEYSREGLLAEVGETDPERTHVAEFIENGTSSMPARPFAGPNVEVIKARFPDLVKRKVEAVSR